MGRYLLQRVLYMVPTVLAALLIVFTLAKLTPGDPVTIMLAKAAAASGVGVSAEEAEALAKVYGLNRPFLLQFTDYVSHLARFDFGRSISLNRPINQLFARALPISLQLGGAALVLLILLGIPLGTLSAVRSGTWIDNVITGASVIMRAVPVFVAAPILLGGLVLWLHLMKVPYGWKGLFNAQNILPMFILASPGLSLVIQQTRAGVLNVLADDYIRTARAKGLTPWAVIVRHALRNALIPVATSLGLMFAGMVTSTVFIDRMFSFPGFGNLYYNAIPNRDYPVLLGTTAVITLFVSCANLLTDILYGVLDPRIRYGARGH